MYIRPYVRCGYKRCDRNAPLIKEMKYCPFCGVSYSLLDINTELLNDMRIYQDRVFSRLMLFAVFSMLSLVWVGDNYLQLSGSPLFWFSALLPIGIILCSTKITSFLLKRKFTEELKDTTV